VARILVTGGCGFIGSHLVEALVNDGHQVVVVDNLSTGKLENIEGVSKQVEFHQVDIRDLSALMRLTQDIDYVYHEAAIGSVPRSLDDPVTTDSVNVGGTLNVLVAAKESRVRRVVFASSSSVYGDTPALPKLETMLPMPMSPYAASKLAGEMYMQAFYNSYGLETISLRYFNVFGPRQDPRSEYAAVIPRFILALINGERPTVFGDGMQSRDFTYVQDIVQANLLAMKAPCTHSEAVNIACEQAITLNQLLEMLQEALARRVEPVYAESRPGDVRHSWADCSEARRVIGYSPVVSITEGLRLTCEWFLEKQLRSQPSPEQDCFGCGVSVGT
jgi:nucleoside-diphosphate-sugar epimerase